MEWERGEDNGCSAGITLLRFCVQPKVYPMSALDLAHKMTILSGIKCEMIAPLKDRDNVGSRKVVFTQILPHFTKIYL